MNKKSDENKVTYIKFRCTVEEKNIIKNKTIEAGYNKVSEFIRDRTIYDSVIILESKALNINLNKIGQEVGKIGNNINQIAKVVNANEKAGNPMNEDLL